MLALRSRAISIPRAHTSNRLAVAARMRFYSVVVDAPRKTKVWDSVDEAVKDVKSGDIILSGGAFSRGVRTRRSSSIAV